MLGPMLLHWDGNMDSYHKITYHIQAKLADIDQTNLIFGSKEEFAAVKAVNVSFPNATCVLCAKHLNDNAIVNRGKSLFQPEVTNIISKLFGESDILASVSFFYWLFPLPLYRCVWIKLNFYFTMLK